MSKIYVSEFGDLAGTPTAEGAVPIFPVPALAEYSIVVSAGSSGGPALQSGTKWVELSADTTASFVIGTSGASAGLNNARLNSNERIVRRVQFQPQSVVNGNVLTLTTLAVFTTANV
jgi:hypothetical protein